MSEIYISKDVIWNEKAVESSQAFQSQHTVITEEHFITFEKDSGGTVERIE